MTLKTTYRIRPRGARFAAQMNRAARLGDFLTWDATAKSWSTTDADAAALMGRLGAEVYADR